MTDTHVLMLVVPFATNVWWTKSWLMDPIDSRWRFAVSAFAGTIGWIYLAFASTRVVEASNGQPIVYGSTSLAYVCAFMALVSVVGIILGLLLWTEEAGSEVTQSLPANIRG